MDILKIVSSILNILIMVSLTVFICFGIIISDGDVSRKVILKCRICGTIAVAGFGLFLLLALMFVTPVNWVSTILAGVIMVAITWSVCAITSQRSRPTK